VVSVIKGLLHVMIHRCQILKADLNRDFRFGPLSRASYASPAPDNNEFATMGMFVKSFALASRKLLLQSRQKHHRLNRRQLIQIRRTQCSTTEASNAVKAV
jgi:hypothetical protein